MMKESFAYDQKWDQFQSFHLYQLLNDNEKEDIKNICKSHLFSFQEFKNYVETYKDFKMWEKPNLNSLWEEWIRKSPLKGRELKKENLKKLSNLIQKYKEEPTNYGEILKKSNPPAKKLAFKESPHDEKILGYCPVASEKTSCCNLRTLDAVKNCGFGCSYCAIETMYSGGKVVFHKNFKEKLKAIELDPEKFYHIGTGQSSDALIWGNKNGILDDLVDFANKNKNVFLEFKTKSDNIKYFLETDIPKNIFCSWSLNPQLIIDHEEHKTASLKKRIEAAKKVVQKGIKVGFHFHPIVYFKGWDEAYQKIVQEILSNFDPKDVIIISLGTLTFPKPIVKKIRTYEVPSQILQMPMVSNPEGKLTYPEEIKFQLFNNVYQFFSKWHSQVFFYLCMEERKFWEKALGYKYNSNEEFENAMLSIMKEKMLT